MTILMEDHFDEVPAPSNLRINDQIRVFRERCRKHGCKRPYHHFAFGQSPFPPCRDAWGPSLKPTFLRNLELRKLPGREAKSRGPSKPELVSLKMSCN